MRICIPSFDTQLLQIVCRCLRRPAGVSHGCSCSPVEAVTAELHTSRSSALRWLVFVLLAGAYKEHSRRIVAVSNRSQTAGQTAVTRTMLWLPIHHFFLQQLATSLVRNSLITTNKQPPPQPPPHLTVFPSNPAATELPALRMPRTLSMRCVCYHTGDR